MARNVKKSRTYKEKPQEPKIYVSKEIAFDISKLENEFYRADIELHNVDHSGPSYEGRVFLNNPAANHKTELTLDNGYVGSYNIFGHGGCFGDVGHCDIPTVRRMYEYRPSHHLKPQYKRLIITDALKKLGGKTTKFTITIVPVLPGTFIEDTRLGNKDIVQFEKIGIITYD
jgi:tyrosinase